MRCQFSDIRTSLTVLLLASLFLSPHTRAEAEQGVVEMSGSSDYVSSGTSGFNGLNINTFLGADTFYNAGYTGSRAVVANVEAGSVWNGHETLTQVTTFLHATESGTQLGQYDQHATWVGQAIAGQGVQDYQRGIAYGATLWSGAVATSFTSGGGFSFDNASFTTPYYQAMQVGVNGRKADVVNSSFGYTDMSGSNYFTIAPDALAAANGTTFVVAAGNSGPGGDTVSGPATGYNNIAVAALGTDSSSPAYNTVSSFSSRGPSDFYNPITKQTITGARAGVDIAAPGEDLTLADYGGSTGSNTGQKSDLTGGASNVYNTGLAGTSFAAPTVAGGAALIVDAGYARFNTAQAVDGRVVKAVLLNSADKTAGWSNGLAADASGVLTTTQSLDYSVGAGRMDLTKAYSQYLTGTDDIVGTGGGTVQAIGWDFGQVGTGNLVNDYVFAQPLLGGSLFTGTLDWFADRTAVFATVGTNTSTYTENDNSLANLDLQLYEVVNSQNQLIAQSDSLYNNTEHFSFTLPSTGSYFLRTLWNGDVYGYDTSASYGVAWAGTSITATPEPSAPATLALGALGLAGLTAGRRRRGQTNVV